MTELVPDLDAPRPGALLDVSGWHGAPSMLSDICPVKVISCLVVQATLDLQLGLA